MPAVEDFLDATALGGLTCSFMVMAHEGPIAMFGYCSRRDEFTL